MKILRKRLNVLKELPQKSFSEKGKNKATIVQQNLEEDIKIKCQPPKQCTAKRAESS